MLLLPVGWVAAAAAVLDLVLLLLRVLIAFILTVLVLSVVCVCCSWLCAMSGGEALLGAVLDHQPPP
jgi:hypothetical protein